MIHKFEGIEKDANARDNIYVFIDEAHRSVARELGTYLMAALPNSTIVGFTGTPIARTAHGEGTFKIFGADDDQGYLDKYSIAESIEDETTLPIRHMMAPSEMTVPAAQLDREFFALAEMEGVTDVDELNRVLGPGCGVAHLSHRRRSDREGGHIRSTAFSRERAAAGLQGVPGGRSTEKPAPSTSEHWTGCFRQSGSSLCIRRMLMTLRRGPLSPSFRFRRSGRKTFA